MANTYTTGLRLSKPGLGDAGWGTTVNGGFTDLVDQAVVGSVDVAVTSGGTTTLPVISDGASANARNMSLAITGSLTTGQTATVQVPATVAGITKLYSVANGAGGTVTVETSGGTTVAVPDGARMLLRVTSAGVREAVNYVASLTLGAALPATSGGTGQSSYTIGDLLYASSTTALSKLAAAAVGNVLRAKGTGTAPAWEKADLTTDVTGTLPVANGGTGAATLTANNVLLGNGTSAPLTVAPGTSGNVLTSNGTTWQSTALPGVNAQVYTSGSGNFTIPANVTKLKVTVVGGGGGSAGSVSGNTGGGGGGGGAAIKWLTGMTPGNTLSYSVGAGGTAGTSAPGNGGAGSASTVATGTTGTPQTITTLTGGGGGAGLTGGSGGSGGGGTNGDLNVPGGSFGGYGIGGDSIYASASPYGSLGSAAYGGGASSSPSASGPGAAGAAGVIIFEW
jgi:hypothetical protein